MSTPSARLGAIQGPPPAPFELTRADAEAFTGGRWHGRAAAVTVHGATIDSRLVRKGSLFACLPGVRADGHDFAATAAGSGAALVLATRELDVPVTVLVVPDVVVALQRLATEFRRRHRGATWIGVTGSSGKTTVKELIAAACAPAAKAAGRCVHATRGNLNNHIGVPLTVLATPVDAAFAVIEMGANHRGEIATLAAIAKPDVGVIASLGPAHLEGFGGFAGVVVGKSELFAALSAGAVAVLGLHGLAENAAVHDFTVDALLVPLRAAAEGRQLLMVGDAAHPVTGDVEPEAIVLRTADGLARIPLLGRHNLANAAVAWQAARAAGVTGAQALAGLAHVAAISGRLQARLLGPHRVLDDTYNANPASMVAGLEVLAAAPGTRLAVLGAMGELGAASLAGHRQVGAAAARLGLPLITVGTGARAIADGYRAAGGVDHEHHDDKATAASAAARRLAGGPTTVLVKASRSSGLEVVVEALMAAQPIPLDQVR